jgi:hypothetical protein
MGFFNGAARSAAGRNGITQKPIKNSIFDLLFVRCR